MKQFTENQVNEMVTNTSTLPSGMYPRTVFPSNLSFEDNCVFADYTEFGANCRFGKNTTFGCQTSIGDNATFAGHFTVACMSIGTATQENTNE